MYTHATFTSESVCAGHPDKIADQISDCIVDAVLSQDPRGRVGVETLVCENQIIIAGEITAQAHVDYAAHARAEIKRLGYTDPALHFTDQSEMSLCIHEQSPEIAQGVAQKGAGDQGMMFGFACLETKELMPLPIMLAHALTARIDTVREDGTIAYLRPDGKSQVTVAYDQGKPVGVKTVVLAVPHQEKVALEQIKKELYQFVVEPVLGHYGYQVPEQEVIVNGTGVWHFSGPAADTGLTGRKIVVDTYGGYARVGGGCFSGKDPSKVDRSGAYAARFIAKNIVAAGLAERAEVRLAYYIGAPQPIMKEIETFGTHTVSQTDIRNFADNLLNCSVEGIIDSLELRQPIYKQTAAYGHFGREGLPWERLVT